MISQLIQRLTCMTLPLIVAAACFMPAPPVQARSNTTAIAVFSGIAGAMVGAGLQKAADREAYRQQRNSCRHPHYGHRKGCQQPMCCIPQDQYQKMLMKQVIASYDPAYHNYWVEYVMIDLDGQLNPRQQEHLVQLLNQRRGGGSTSCVYRH